MYFSYASIPVNFIIHVYVTSIQYIVYLFKIISRLHANCISYLSILGLPGRSYTLAYSNILTSIFQAFIHHLFTTFHSKSFQPFTIYQTSFYSLSS